MAQDKGASAEAAKAAERARDDLAAQAQELRMGYIKVEQCDLDLEEALRAAYAVNGPVVSLIAEFREEIAARAHGAA